MANPSKAKGTRAETKVVKYLKDAGLEAKRQPLSGNKDIGDIICFSRQEGSDKKNGSVPYIIEVKTGKMTVNPSRSQLDDWWQQAVTEANNADGIPVLIVVRYRRKLEDADVWYMWMGHWAHAFLDHWAKYRA